MNRLTVGVLKDHAIQAGRVPIVLIRSEVVVKTYKVLVNIEWPDTIIALLRGEVAPWSVSLRRDIADVMIKCGNVLAVTPAK